MKHRLPAPPATLAVAEAALPDSATPCAVTTSVNALRRAEATTSRCCSAVPIADSARTAPPAAMTTCARAACATRESVHYPRRMEAFVYDTRAVRAGFATLDFARHYIRDLPSALASVEMHARAEVVPLVLASRSVATALATSVRPAEATTSRCCSAAPIADSARTAPPAAMTTCA